MNNGIIIILGGAGFCPSTVGYLYEPSNWIFSKLKNQSSNDPTTPASKKPDVMGGGGGSLFQMIFRISSWKGWFLRFNMLHPGKLTAKAPEKWTGLEWLENDRFLLGWPVFRGELLVSGSVTFRGGLSSSNQSWDISYSKAFICCLSASMQSRKDTGMSPAGTQ